MRVCVCTQTLNRDNLENATYVQAKFVPAVPGLQVDTAAGYSFGVVGTRSVGAAQVNASVDIMVHRRLINLIDLRGECVSSACVPLCVHTDPGFVCVCVCVPLWQ